MTTPDRPVGADLGASGAHLWDEVTGIYDLDPTERASLAAACRQLDAVTGLEAVVADEGLTVDTKAGPRVHPAMAEARQGRVVLGKLLASVRLPAGEAKALSAAGERAQHAARARWGDGARGRDRHGRSTGASN